MNKTNIIFFTIFSLCLSIIGCSEESGHSSQKKSLVYEGSIVAIGDSLTEGLGVDEEFAYPARLERKLMELGYRYRVINAGISGETSHGTLSRIKWVLKLDPDIVVLVIGANDGFRGFKSGYIKSNITKIVQSLKENDVIVVLGGMRIVQNLGETYTTAFAKIYSEIAKIEKVILIPFFLQGVAGEPKLNQADGIHPTAEGYRRIVENIYPYVVKAIKLHRAKKN
ncbi:MAG: arylesterase [Desulfobacterales bacterium]